MPGVKGAVILIIDDEAIVRRTFGRFLEHFGYRVLEASDGEKGVDIVTSDNPEKPQLALVDLHLPGMNGMEVLKRLKSARPEMPVIMISGAGVLQDAVEALNRGAWDYLEKPILDMKLLIHRVEKCLEKAQLKKSLALYHRHLETTVQKVSEDEEAGRKVQARLLPPTPFEVSGCVLERFVMPSLTLSGDFVDYFIISPGTWAFYSADVSGHGVSSALVTVYLRSFVRKFLEKHHSEGDSTILDPAGLLTVLNTELLAEDFGKHLTMFYAIFTSPSGDGCRPDRMTYSTGGQFPFPMLHGPDGTVTKLEVPGGAVGLFPDFPFENNTVELKPPFMLTVFSDGVLDAMTCGDTNCKIATLKSLNTRERVLALTRDLAALKEIPDDITILMVRSK